MASSRSLLRAASGLGLLGGAALGYALWEARQYGVREEQVPVLPAGSAPLRVLHLSDIHLAPWDADRARWLESLDALEPDLVVSTGDHIAHRDAVAMLLHSLGPLLHRPGLFVFGSNDYYAPVLKNPLRYLRRGPAPLQTSQWLPWEDLRDGLTAAGWIDLNNERHQLKAGDVVIDAVGVDDPHIGRDRYDEVAGPAAPDADLSLGVVHAPYRRVLDAMTHDGRALILAGHTHGGQVCLPGYGTLVTNCDLDRRRARGLTPYAVEARNATERWERYDRSWLNVSAGIGTSPYTPIRVACRPEAVLLTLVPAGG